MNASRSPLFQAACWASSTSWTAFLDLASSSAGRATLVAANQPRRPATATRTRRASLVCNPLCIGELLEAEVGSRFRSTSMPLTAREVPPVSYVLPVEDARPLARYSVRALASREECRPSFDFDPGRRV